MVILRILKELGLMVIELLALAFYLVVVPALMITLAAACAGILTGVVMSLLGHETGHTIAYGGGIVLVLVLVIGGLLDYMYSFLP